MLRGEQSVTRGRRRGRGFHTRKYHYVRQRPRWLKLLPLLVLSAGGLVTVLFTMGFVDRVSIPTELRPARRPELRELSNEGRYGEVLNWSAEILADQPLDSEALLFRGIAHFHVALAADRVGSGRVRPGSGLDEAIVALRRARLDENLRYRNEAAYVLGKAYYHKGSYYYESAIRYLTESLRGGGARDDVHEYLGMAHVRTGDLDTGMEHFSIALERTPNALLYLSVGQLLQRMERPEEALQHFEAAVEHAQDQAVETRARFMLGALLLENHRYTAARDQYQQILEIDPASADAHVFLGDAHAGLGQVVQARAEWRRARSIDEQHHGANLRLRR